MDRPFRLLAILLMISGAQMTFAQEAKPLKIGLAFSANSYMGDLLESPNKSIRVYPGMNINIQFQGKKSLQLQANLGFGRLVEQWDSPIPLEAPDGIIPNDYVSTGFSYAELHLLYIFGKKKLTPFAGLGLGLLQFAPKDAAGNFLSDAFFSRTENEDFSSLTVSMPIKAGLEYRIQHEFSLFCTYTYRFTGTDYLDNLGVLGGRKGNDGIHQLLLGISLLLGE